MNTILSIGDSSDNGQITIIDEDRLCYLVKSTSRGAYGLRTISKSLLEEYIDYFSKHPDATANDARDALSGSSEIDKFEYGYTSTLRVMALMALGQIEKSTNQSITIPHKNREFDFPLQQIFYGAPGTGKSHRIKEIIQENGIDEKEQVIRTTFHPDSDYSTFVGCYKPTMTEKPVRNVAGDVVKKSDKEVVEKVITYAFTSQTFTKAYLRAWQMEEDVFLVIEEINRGNCAQIFGDLFQLLDRDDDGFSEYAIKADNDLAAYLAEHLSDSKRTDIPESVKSGEELLLPANLYIWATMNTSDQSLFPIDSAFKRRWEWKYIPIDTRKENWTIKVDGADYDWSDFLEKINKKIESTTHSEDKMLGFYFCKAENSTINAERFVNKVAFYLWNDVFKDYGFDDAIFNDENGEKLSFHKFYKNDGTVEEAKVKTFLDKLGVTHQGETSVDIGEELQ